MNCKRTLMALGATALAAFPAAAAAKGDHGAPDKGKPAHADRAKPTNYEFKGLVTAVGAGSVSFEVRAGNNRGRKLKGQVLTLDVSEAKIVVRDVNKDGKRDLADIAVGDRVQAQVRARLRRGEALDTTTALPARHVIDKGPVPVNADTTGDHAPEQPGDAPAS